MTVNLNTENRTTIEQVYPLLHGLGLLNNSEVAQVEKALAKTYVAQRATKEHETLTIRQADEIGAELVQNDDLDVSHVIDGALALPDQAAVDLVATRTFEQALAQARKLAYKRLGQLPGKINDAYAKLQAEFKALKLGNVRTAEQAIAAGVVEDWVKLSEIRAQSSELGSIASTVRTKGLFAEPTPSDSGPWWRLRKPEDPDAYARYGDDELGRWLAMFAREPYMPASREEARAVAESWTTEGASA